LETYPSIKYCLSFYVDCMLVGRHLCLMLKIIILKMELDICSTHWNRHSMFRRLFISADDGTRDSLREALCSMKKNLDNGKTKTHVSTQQLSPLRYLIQNVLECSQSILEISSYLKGVAFC